MYSNLGSPDVAPVILRFNYEAHAKFEVGQPTYNVLLLIAYLTLYCDLDLWSLTLTFELVVM